jgi:alkylation response protein AidB-like acyl-CoA dehydrogenase
MNFDLTEEQQMMVESVAKFVATDSPVSRFRGLRDSSPGWEPVVWETMGEMGWLSVAFPEEQGGFGGSFVDVALILEQFGRGLVPEPYIASVVLAGGLLSSLGTEGQVEEFLTPMIAGKSSLALAYQERQSRYDLADCRTLATRNADSFVLEGEKTWVLNGTGADQIVVLARTAGDARDEGGLSLFVVDRDSPGLTRTETRGMDGQRSAVLHFDRVAVGADRLLGPEGGAFSALDWAIDRGAAAACAEGLGEIEELFERTVAYLKERAQFGVPIGSFQALQHRAADMFAEVELCKSMMVLAAIRADNGDSESAAQERQGAISTAKLQLQDGGWFVQENAIQLHGGIGVTDEQDEGLFFKRVRVLQSLFGDADYHVRRYQSLPGFEASLGR